MQPEHSRLKFPGPATAFRPTLTPAYKKQLNVTYKRLYISARQSESGGRKAHRCRWQACAQLWCERFSFCGASRPRSHSRSSSSTSQGRAHRTACRSVHTSAPHVATRNSSGDEIANVNFRYDDIVHVLQNTMDSCIPPQIDAAVMCGTHVYQIQ